jgi:hypothetical protein
MRVLWIRIGFIADPDPTFYLNPDPDLGQTLKSQKVEFFHGNVLKVGTCTKAFLKGRFI